MTKFIASRKESFKISIGQIRTGMTKPIDLKK